MHKMRKIGSIITVSSGGTPNRKREDYYSGGTIPWVKTGDLKGKFIEKPKEYITPVGLQNSSAKLFPKNTVLVAMYGATIGACSILDEEAATNQACAALLPCSEIEPAFLYFYFSSIKNDLVNKGVGGAQPNISLGILKNLEIPLPSLEEQKKIAAILDAADEYRQKTKALIDKYDQLTQSLFLDMFGDLDGKATLLGEFIKLLGGGTPSKDVEEFWNGNIPWASVKDLKSDYLISTQDSITEDGVSNSATRIVKKGTLIIATRMAVGKCAIPTKDMAINQDLKAVKIIKGLNVKFLQFLLKSKKSHFEHVSTGATVKGIKISHITDLKVLIPELSLQNQFAERVAQIEKQKQQAEASLVKAEELFSSLLQRAFKGELTS